jgi:hypothetical protein
MYPPTLRELRRSAQYLYEQLRQMPLAATAFAEVPKSAKQYYEYFYRLANEQYRAADPSLGASLTASTR